MPSPSHRHRLPLALLATLAAFSCAAPPPTAPRPDVLLVLVDCLRADHVGAYGYPLRTTPNLDRLAGEGILFEQAYSNATWTKPSMATLFTGLHPSEHGLLQLGLPASDEIETDALAEGTPMLAERFAAAGYHTLAVVRQVHLQPQFGFARGFADYRWLEKGTAGNQNKSFAQGLAAAPPGKPLFAWIHYIDAHWPYRVQRGAEEEPFGPVRMEPEPPFEQGREVIASWVRAHLDERNRRALMARYDGEVAAVDWAIGDLLQQLAARGRLDNTLVVVTADHGEGFFEHGHLMHGFAPYDEVARVPLIVRPPRSLALPPGRRTTPVGHAGLAATLLDLLALPPLPAGREASYAEVWRGRETPGRPVLIQTEFTAALRDGRWKLLLGTDGRRELYDLAADPGELRNLAGTECTGECSELESLLRRRMGALQEPPPLGRARYSSSDVEILRALGYL